MTGARAVVVGTIGIDFLSDSDHAPFARTSVGNSGANIAMRLAAAGFDTDLIALVGEDDLADAAREDLVAGGVDVEGVVSRRKYETPRVFHVVSDDPHLLFTCPVCGSPRGHALALPRIDEVPSAVLDRAARADLIVADVAGALTDLVFGRGESALRWYEQSLTEAGAADMVAVARAADIVKVSHEDESHFAPCASTSGPRIRIVTRGDEGVDVSARPDRTGPWPEPTTYAAPRIPDVVETIGAGDAFTAAAAARLVGGGAQTDWVAAGQSAAALACRFAGARGDMIDTVRGHAAPTRPLRPFRCAACDRVAS